jgi:hypothetical protein
VRAERKQSNAVNKVNCTVRFMSSWQAACQHMRELRAQGKASDEEAQLLSAEFRVQYPDWDNPDWISDTVRRFYSEFR